MIQLGTELKYKVLVRCFTYNQSSYISDALKGFVAQNTTFPFICLIMDDCSTDGEQDVLKSWIEQECNLDTAETTDLPESSVRIVSHKSNPNCHFAFYFLKKNLNSDKNKKMSLLKPWREICEYEAICEGDDYWTNANKLQKQVDFLDRNDDYSLTFHRVETISEKGRIKHDYFAHLQTREYTTEEMLKQWTVPTGSMLMRTSIIPHIPSNTKFRYGDNVIVLTCLRFGKMYCFGECMGVYRLTSSGWTGQAIDINCKKQISHIEGLIETFESCQNDIMLDNLRNEYIRLISAKIYKLELSDALEVFNDYKKRFDNIKFLKILKSTIIFCAKQLVKDILKSFRII